MLAHRPSLRRPPLSAWRLVGGLSPAAVARAEAVTEREITALLAQPDFRELVDALEELQGLPEAERLLRLERHAWCVLELALADSDWRAAAFIADQLRRGCNPARMLAKGVLKAQARAASPPPPPAAEPAAPPPPRAPRPYDPVGAAMRRAAAAMRAAIAAETALTLAPGRPATAPATPPTVTSEPTAPARPRRPDALAARLRGGTATPPSTATAPDPRGLLRAWAQGP